MELPVFADVYALVAVGVLTISKQPAEALRFARYLADRDKGQPLFQQDGYDPLHRARSGDRAPTVGAKSSWRIPQPNVEARSPDRASFGTPADWPFFLALSVLGGAYLLLIAAMLTADASYTSPLRLWQALGQPGHPLRRLAEPDFLFDHRHPVGVGRPCRSAICCRVSTSPAGR